MRIIMFILVWSSFPIVNHFFRSGLIKLLKPKLSEDDDEVSAFLFNSLTVLTVMIPFLITVLYPKIADILSVIGSVGGLLIVYVFPVVSYLVKLFEESQNPILTHVTDMDWQYQNNKLY